ncbi:MAG: hypothetical protein B1H03_03770 [Planctomycetales bacterium 4484_113]|nr:MAG: hypothetical protein B1H03_03770 [Planctomycetales bacterium 4484_113]
MFRRKDSLLPVMPMPQVVFFPETFVDIHVVEEGHRQMVSSVRTHNWPIGIFLARESEGETLLARCESVGTFGRIVRVEQLRTGISKLTLRGKFRGRLHRFDQTEPFPLARVEMLTDHLHPDSPEALERALKELISLVQSFKPAAKREQVELPPLESWNRLFSTLLNSVAMLLPVMVEKKQQWLVQDDLLVRYKMMRDEMQRLLKFNRLLELIPPPADDPHLN